jgi:hypothetical protein
MENARAGRCLEHSVKIGGEWCGARGTSVPGSGIVVKLFTPRSEIDFTDATLDQEMEELVRSQLARNSPGEVTTPVLPLVKSPGRSKVGAKRSLRSRSEPEVGEP